MAPERNPTTSKSPEQGLPAQPALAAIAAGLLLVLPAGVMAKERQHTICCRTPGGSRSAEMCLRKWAHLVPRNEYGEPALNRTLAVLQGASETPTALTIQLRTLGGELVGEQTLPAMPAGIWLLQAPAPDRPELQQVLVWETFPQCRASKPPARTLLERSVPPASNNVALLTTKLQQSCGAQVSTVPLLQSLQLEDYFSPQNRATLPSNLPVRCLSLTAKSMGIDPRRGGEPTELAPSAEPSAQTPAKTPAEK
jgi:hypothetical protein